MIAMIGPSDRLCWLAETCKILLLLLLLPPCIIMSALATISITISEVAIIGCISGNCFCRADVACKLCTGRVNDRPQVSAFDGVGSPLASTLAKLGWADWWAGHRPGRQPAGRGEELLW